MAKLGFKKEYPISTNAYIKEDSPQTRAEHFFWRVTEHPKTVLILGIFSICAISIVIPKVITDTSGEAFIPKDHPSVIYRDTVKEVFGLADPIVIAVVNESNTGIFNPQTLSLVHWLTEKTKTIEGVDPEKVKSIATENNITGTEEGMIIEPFMDKPPTTQAEANMLYVQRQL